MLEPKTQADVLLDNRDGLFHLDASPIPLTQVMIHPLVSLSRPIFAALPAATPRLGTLEKLAGQEKKYVNSGTTKWTLGMKSVMISIG